MAFPTTGLLDDFNRASLGANWTTILGTPQITSNQYAGGASNSWAAYNVSTYGPDSENYVDIPTVPTAGNTVTLVARGTTLSVATVDGYVVNMQKSAGTDTYGIYRVDNGVQTLLGAAINQETASGDSAGIEVVGTSISAYYKASGGSWTNLGSRTDGTYTAAGYLMILIGDTTGRMDNFSGGKVVTSTTHNGGASMGAAGWLSAQTQKTLLGGAGTGAAGWLSAQAQKTLYGGAGLGGAGWITAAGQLVKSGGLDVGGVGGLGIFGERIAFGSASMGGAGWLSAESQKILYGGAGQGAAGWLNAETLKILIGAAGLEAIGQMLADGTGTATGTTHAGGASLDGHGWLSVIAERIAEGAADMGGHGWLDTFGERVAQAAADLAAAGWLSAAGQRISLGAIDLGAAGYISLTATITHNASAQLGAAGYLSADVLVQALTTGAGNRRPYDPNERAPYQQHMDRIGRDGDRNPIMADQRGGRKSNQRRSY